MPRYEYRCKDCGHRFEKVMSVSEHENSRKIRCPKCDSAKVEQVPTAFSALTGKKT